MTPQSITPRSTTPNAQNPVQALAPVQQARPTAGTEAGQSFSNDPFARMLEQSRQSARLQARREQDREKSAAPARKPEQAPLSGSPEQAPSANAAGGQKLATAAATQEATRKVPDQTPKQASTDSDKATQAQADTAPSSNSNLRKGAKLPPIATQPGEPDPPGSDPEAPKVPGASGVRCLLREGPIECPVEHLHLMQPQQAQQAQADTAPSSNSNLPKGAKLPPIATQPGEPDPPGFDPEAPKVPGASGVRRLLREGPIECPVEPWHLMQPQQAHQAKTAAAAQRAAIADAATTAKTELHAARGADAQLQPAALAVAAAAADAADLATAGPAGPLAGAGQAAPASTAATPTLPASNTQTQAQAHLPAHPNSASFGMQLSHQVTLWLRQGVTEARLSLNPAELGPVQISISLDGQAAQVRLGAEQALTRQALELALPGLASTLAEAGFLLAGGGVFDQAPDQTPRDSPGGHDSRSAATARADDGANTPPTQPAPRPTRGQVDLVA